MHFWQRYIWHVSREYSRNIIDELELLLSNFTNSNITPEYHRHLTHYNHIITVILLFSLMQVYATLQFVIDVR